MVQNNRFALPIILVLLCGMALTLGTKQITIARANSLNASACGKRDPNIVMKAIALYDSNPVYYSNLACLIAQRDTCYHFCDFVNGLIPLPISLDSSVLCMKQALVLAEKEKVIIENLSILYALSEDFDTARETIKPDSVSLVGICLAGILDEFSGNELEAETKYTKAVVGYPSILSSRFYKDLSGRNEALAITVVQNAGDILKAKNTPVSDPIDAAKYGCLLYEIGEYKAAKLYLEDAIKELPSLNRSWYYLGEIARCEGDSTYAVSCYSKAHFLDPMDKAPIRMYREMDTSYQPPISYYNSENLSEQAITLRKHYGAKSLSNPYILSNVESYFRTSL